MSLCTACPMHGLGDLIHQILFRKSEDQPGTSETVSAFPVVRLPASIRAGVKREKDEYDDEEEEEEDESLKSAQKGKAKREEDDEYQFDASVQEVDEEEEEDAVKKPVGARSSRLKISDLCSPQEDEED